MGDNNKVNKSFYEEQKKNGAKKSCCTIMNEQATETTKNKMEIYIVAN